MSTLQFPKNPSINDEYDWEGFKYVYDGQKWKTIGVGYNPVNDLKDKLEPRIDELEDDVTQLQSGNSSLVQAVDSLNVRVAAEEKDTKDWEVFTAELLAQAGIVDDGQPDELGKSKRVEAVINIAGRTFKTVADMKSATNLKEGQSVKTNGYSSAGDGRGASYIIKTYAQAELDGDAADGYLNHISSDGLYVAVIQLEKQKPNKNWDVTVPTACAHRGLSAFTPENSIISLAQAWESGFKYAEVDLYPCLDDLLILHDSTLDRTTNGVGDVGVMTSAQVKQYNMKASGLMIPSLRASFDVYFPNEKVPTLDEFFAEIRRTGLNVIIECKLFSDSERIEFLHRLVAAGLLSQVMLQSTNFSVIEHFKSLDSRVEIGLVNPVSQPIDYGNVDRCAKIGAWLNTDASKLTEADAQYAKGNGVRLACYTANTQAMYQTMQRYGVNLILSDYLSKGY